MGVVPERELETYTLLDIQNSDLCGPDPQNHHCRLSALPPMKSLLRNLSLHATLVLIVLLVPGAVYELVSQSRFRNVELLAFGGAVTYPAYIGLWTRKLRSERARFILFHLLLVLVTAFVAFIVGGNQPSLARIMTPAAVGAATLPVAAIAALRGNRWLAVTSLGSAAISLPVGAILSWVIFVGAALSGMHGGM
ncbi:hypothetical protein [Cupriavidus phytorum]|nr:MULTISPECIES: hypothetical protein [Cupriavidus]